MVNAGVSGDTTTLALSRLPGVLARKPAIVIVALGANDGVRGVPVATMRQNISRVIRDLQASGARVILCAMEALPLYGWSYTSTSIMRSPSLAREHDVPLVPFFMANIVGRENLLLGEWLHPNAEGARVIAKRSRRVSSAPSRGQSRPDQSGGSQPVDSGITPTRAASRNAPCTSGSTNACRGRGRWVAKNFRGGRAYVPVCCRCDGCTKGGAGRPHGGTGDFPGARQHPHPVRRARAIRCEPGAGHRGRVRLRITRAARFRSTVNRRRARTRYSSNLPAGYYEVIATWSRRETGPSKVVREKFQVVAGRGDTQ